MIFRRKNKLLITLIHRTRKGTGTRDVEVIRVPGVENIFEIELGPRESFRVIVKEIK